jgi:hypothetical protein
LLAEKNEKGQAKMPFPSKKPEHRSGLFLLSINACEVDGDNRVVSYARARGIPQKGGQGCWIGETL